MHCRTEGRTHTSQNLKVEIDDTKGKQKYHVAVMRFAMNTYVGKFITSLFRIIAQ